jgi:hypothetical protein
MFELLRSPKTCGVIQAPPTALLFLTGSNLSGPSLNHAPQVFVTPLFWGVVWDALTLPLTSKLPQTAPTLTAAFAFQYAC